MSVDHIGYIGNSGSSAFPMCAAAKPRPVSAVSALAMPLDQAAVPDTGDGASAGDVVEEEAAWLALHDRLLLLTPACSEESPPYAFASLQNAVLKEVDAGGKRLVLSRKGSTTSWQPAVPDEDDTADWLELCLLLGDGRFQPLEAPQLELRFPREADFKVWLNHLTMRCVDDSRAHPPEFRLGDERLPSHLEANWPEDSKLPGRPAQPAGGDSGDVLSDVTGDDSGSGEAAAAAAAAAVAAMRGAARQRQI